MKNKCSICFKKIEKSHGCYSTPRGIFCVLCYDKNKVLKYAPHDTISSEKKSLNIHGASQLSTR